jgi:hypothetical protein
MGSYIAQLYQPSNTGNLAFLGWLIDNFVCGQSKSTSYGFQVCAISSQIHLHFFSCRSLNLQIRIFLWGLFVPYEQQVASKHLQLSLRV